ncbi:MAG: BON domain-containing protein [Porticoccaceae bacterium]|nr:BON domain-containing protein [Porticoccaceae bacterium]
MSLNLRAKYDLRYFFLIALLTSVSGCTTILDITREDPIEVDPYSRSLGAKLDDSNLETIIGHNINRAHPDLDSAHVEVHSFNSVVLLTGEVPSEDLKSMASEVVNDVSSARQLYNELEVRANSSILSRANDSYLRQKIALRFLREPSLKGADLEIVVEDSVAFLMGLTNAEQAEVAAHEASLTGGIRRVVKVFEYVE